MENAIEIRNVTKRFKETVAVKNVTVSFEKGKIHGIIGRNGSGKTVLFKCVSGLFPVTEGEISVLGQKIGDGKRVPRSLGAIIETPGFLPNCSGFQNLWYLMQAARQIRRESARPSPWWAWTRTAKSTLENTPWACASGWAWPRPLWRTRSC